MILELLALALAQPAAAPSTEAETLGLRLSRTGTLGTLLPLMISKDIDELVKSHPELNAAERAQLRASAQRTGERATTRALQVEGHAYASLLSLADLRALVAAAESPAAVRQRAALPQVIIATVTGLNGFDFKKEAAAAFCRETGKACPAPPSSTK